MTARLRILLCGLVLVAAFTSNGAAQNKKVRIAIPGYTIAMVSLLAAKMNGYYVAEGLETELVAMQAPTANLALVAGNVEFSAVPLAGLTTALRGAPLNVFFVTLKKPQHVVFAKPEIQNIQMLRGKKIAVAGLGVIDGILMKELLTMNGIDVNRDVTLLSMGASDTRFAALVSGAVDAAVLIAPHTFNAKEAGLKELVAFKDQGFVLPSGGIVAREDLLKGDPTMVEKFVRATLMGFLFTHDNRAGTIKVLARSLRVDEQLAAKIYDGSRPTMTADGTLPDEVQKKMIAFVSKLAGAKEVAAMERPFDFSVIRKAHATLRSKGWQP